MPFTTPELAHARVREHPVTSRTEISIPNLTGDKGAHGIPLLNLAETVSLTVHDRALHEQIMATRATTPAKISRIADRLAEDGLAGAAAMQRTRKSRSTHKRVRMQLFLYLIGQAVDDLCTDESRKQKITPGTLATPAGLDLAREALSQFAGQQELCGQDLLDLLEKWARVTACVGSARGQIPGHLTTTVEAMEALSTELEKWLRVEPEESAEMAEWVVKATNCTVGYCRGLLKEINSPAGNFEEALSGFTTVFRNICADVEKLIWVTDGWNAIVREWIRVSAIDRYAQRAFLEDLVRYLPLLPQNLLKKEDLGLWKEFQNRQILWDSGAEGRDERPFDSAAAIAAARLA